jgi:hypothetical protein
LSVSGIWLGISSLEFPQEPVCDNKDLITNCFSTFPKTFSWRREKTKGKNGKRKVKDPGKEIQWAYFLIKLFALAIESKTQGA